MSFIQVPSTTVKKLIAYYTNKHSTMTALCLQELLERRGDTLDYMPHEIPALKKNLLEVMEKFQLKRTAVAFKAGVENRTLKRFFDEPDYCPSPHFFAMIKEFVSHANKWTS